MRARHGAGILLLILATAAMPLPGQIGQYPGGGYPPGSYPPQYPYPGGGGVGIPIPRLPKIGKKKPKAPKDESVPLQDVRGKLRKLDAKSLVVEADDTRILNLKRTEKTHFYQKAEEIQPSKLKAGDRVWVEASQDDQGYLYAVNVHLEKAGTAQRKADTAKPENGASADAPATGGSSQQHSPEPADDTVDASPLPAGPMETGDPGPPVLKRGKPESSGRSETQETADARAPSEPQPELQPQPQSQLQLHPEPASAPAAPQEDPVIAKAREAAAHFTQSLPNYVCQEFMSRFFSNTQPVNWTAQDVVSTEVVYENGHERYRSIRINGKATTKKMEELPGSWSTGEFGTILLNLFSRGTAADFRFREESRTAGLPARVYDFTVDREHSDWHIQVASQSVLPSYKGSVWIDKQNSRVLRIEMQASNLPEEFPLDTVETALDYEYTRLSGQEFLLPVHAETLSCQRGTAICSRNVIDFRNYHRYQGEATIVFDK